jgi:hypothetical protein
MDYDTLMTQTGPAAESTLLDALLSPAYNDGITGYGPMYLFTNALFCLLEREYRRKPDKKKAIVLWEMFVAGNYGTGNAHRLVPNSGALSPLAINLEDRNGVSQAVYAPMSTAIGVIDQAFGASRAKGKSGLFSTTKGVRKLDALNLGGVVHTDLFKPVVDSVKGTIAGITGGPAANILNNPQGKDLWLNNKRVLVKVLKDAGFETNRVGLG